MKREATKPTYRFLWRHYPLLVWKKCANCKCEFVRERGWRYLTGPWCNGAGVVKYLCASCGGETAESATAAIEMINARISAIRPRPPASPPPPRVPA